MDPTKNPLSNADRLTLDKALYNLSQAVVQMDRAEAAGIDMSDLRQQHAQLYDDLMKRKSVYFPGI